MFTPVEAFIGWRYTRARRRTRFVSLISSISIAGVALGIASLITILSIMNGFERELRERILGMAAHLSVKPEQGALGDWRAAAAVLRADRRVAATAPYVEGEAMLTHYNAVQGALVRGVLPAEEAGVSVVAARMKAGTLDSLTGGAFNIVLGRGLADALGLGVGDEVTLVLPEPIRTATGMLPRLKRCRVTGIFEAGVQDYDSSVAFMHLEDAAKVFRLGSGVSGVRARLGDPFTASELGAALNAGPALRALPGAVHATNWTETHVNLFRALKTEKIVMFVILMLSIGVAAFNLVSTLVMVVAEKIAEIAILRTLGMTPRRVLGIFLYQGALIGAAGIVAGVAVGVLLAANVETIVGALERWFHFKILPPDVYYISEIPAELRPQDVVIAIAISIVLCLSAPLYPAWVASRTRPAEVLRHE
ncbi:MAG: lipoprotein-releasing ABC transporter permease subunit [Gammaproteobacteria bacterium]|nr:lipoprotein-releasing ABC transporter permease subunit [Gammaproteobacteria bacterium]MBI5618857.1 lipoprotein-releasing ABC transporter permease subunit [Gammaproteobacteria bacterium]